MGGQQTLTGNGLSARQVIFTSLRTRMGEGYRVVAAGAGVTPDERMEITRCSPSHGGMCGDGPDAQGLAAYRLGSGAQCIALSRHAGVEQSGRGGLRVYTHALLLGDREFAAFGGNPFAVRDAASDLLREPQLKPQPTLELLDLRAPDALDDETLIVLERLPERCAEPELERCAALLVCLLRGRSIIVENCPESLLTLQRVFSALPSPTRSRLTASCGLRFSPYRQFDVILLDHALPSRESRRVAERTANLCDWMALKRETGTPYDDWALFAVRLWKAGDHRTLFQLTHALTDAGPSILSRIASLASTIRQAGRVPVEQAERLAEVSGRPRSQERLESRLCDRLRAVVDERRAETHAAPVA